VTYKRLGIVILLGVFSVILLPASTISFLVIETGLQPEAREGAYSSVWEDGFMSVFFDAGHIVSNSPVLRLDRTPPQGEFPREIQTDFLDASRGGSEYFILVFLEHRSGGIRPQEALIRIFAIGGTSETSRNPIFEQRFPAGTGSSPWEESIRVQETARIIAAQLKDRY